jgi:hypothetical protein
VPRGCDRWGCDLRGHPAQRQRVVAIAVALAVGDPAGPLGFRRQSLRIPDAAFRVKTHGAHSAG